MHWSALDIKNISHLQIKLIHLGKCYSHTQSHPPSPPPAPPSRRGPASTPHDRSHYTPRSQSPCHTGKNNLQRHLAQVFSPGWIHKQLHLQGLHTHHCGSQRGWGIGCLYCLCMRGITFLHRGWKRNILLWNISIHSYPEGYHFKLLGQ